MILLVVALAFVYFLITFVIQPLNYWKKQNIPHTKPWPLVGNMASFVFGRKCGQYFFREFYNKFSNSRYWGMHILSIPVLVIRDPKLIKQITITDFDHFTDHALFQLSENVDPFLSKTLLALMGEKWKEMRCTLGPFFTSSKMKFMFTLIAECSEKYTKHFESLDSDIVELEFKDIFTRFTSDVIGSIGFGLNVNSLEDPNNEFYTKGQDFVNVEGVKALKIMTYVAFPKIAQLLNISILPTHLQKYYTRLIKETIKLRETKGLVRSDMIHLFLEARKALLLSKNENKKKLKDLSDESIVGQSAMFFFAGFVNTMGAMCFLCYELALNPEVQKKLQSEIDEALKSCNGKVTYEALLQMKYLDMVISETLRRWPLGPIIDRRCTKDYVIQPELPNEGEVLIKKGAVIFFPMAGIHHDPKYYQNPTKFDPERFSAENKDSIMPCTFFPMGVGPRFCIGSRLAYLETKILFFHLLSRFDVVPTKKTSIPIKQTKLKLNLGSATGFWLGLKRRCKETQ